MCIMTEVRINKGAGDYVGTNDELRVISELVQHLIVEHEDLFACSVSHEGYLNMLLNNPLVGHRRYVMN